MDQIIIEPGNPNDFRNGELEEVAHLIEAIKPGPIRIAIKEQRGYGVTWWEVIYIWLPPALLTAGAYVGKKAVDKIVDALADEFIKWAKRKFNKEGESPRPKYISILGPDGRPLKSILVQKSKESSEFIITDKTSEDPDHPPRKLPPL